MPDNDWREKHDYSHNANDGARDSYSMSGLFSWLGGKKKKKTACPPGHKMKHDTKTVGVKKDKHGRPIGGTGKQKKTNAHCVRVGAPSNSGSKTTKHDVTMEKMRLDRNRERKYDTGK